MKRERRHELQHNALADWLGTTIKDLKPHTNTILAGVLLVVVVVGVGTVWRNLSHSRATTSWEAFDAAWNNSQSGAADIQSVAEKHPGTSAGMWALLTAAGMQLNSGCDLLFTNKDSAKLELRKAADNYQRFLESKAPDALKEWATFGLAQAHEALSDTDNAKKHYEQLLKTWPNGAFAQSGKQALERLNQPKWGMFYDKFAKFDPKPPTKPDTKLPFDLDVPNEPTPGKKSGSKSSGGIKLQSADFGSGAVKSEPAAKPAESKPADTKPADAKPAEKPGEKPATKPAEKPADAAKK
jgi:hypothetical protein